MKKNFRIILAALALVGAAAACQKNGTPETKPAGRTVTIRVEAPTNLTKISLEQDASDPDGNVNISWQENDHILVGGNDFTIVNSSISADGHFAEFTGTAPSSSTFDIVYEGQAGISDFANQTQAADGDYTHLRYGAKLTGVNSYEALSFSQAYATAHGGSFEQSSVIRLRAQLPADVASAVRGVIFKSSEPIFGGENVLKVNFTTAGDAGADGIITVYANLPAGSWSVPAGADILFQFQVGAAENEIYTAHKLTNAGAIAGGQVTAFKISRPNIKEYANASSASIGSASNPYLIGDKHQLAKMADEMAAGSKIYFKMVDDVDWNNEGWTSLNAADPFSKAVAFDGNSHSILKLDAAFFDHLAGSVENLTLDQASVTVSAATASAAILASQITDSSAAVEITNVDITNGSVSSTASNAYTGSAALVGYLHPLNESSAPIVNITDCDVSGTDIDGIYHIGGLLGWSQAKLSMSGCTYSDGTVAMTSFGRCLGGLIARQEIQVSTIEDCHVTDAVVDASAVAPTSTWTRTGGFIGLSSNDVSIKGCTVGTGSQRVIIKLPAGGTADKPTPLNSGGFAGVNYGLITKDASGNRSKAYVQIQVNNSVNTDLNVGGFVGYNTGTVEYSDVDAILEGATSGSAVVGKRIGGFVGYLYNEYNTNPGLVQYCTATGSVRGGQYLGGIAGYMLRGNVDTFPTINESSSSVTVTGTDHYVGGLAGYIDDGALIGSSATGNVSSPGKNRIGGLVGQAKNGSISKCYATGNVSGAAYAGGLVGTVTNDSGSSFSISRSYYASGTVTTTNNSCGGLVGSHEEFTANAGNGGELSIENCYVSGNVQVSQRGGGILANHYAGTSSIHYTYVSGSVKGYAALGGIVGWVQTDGLSVRSCMPFVTEVSSNATDSDAHYSSGLVIGYANGNANNPTLVVTSCWRPAGTVFNDCPGNAANVVENYGFIDPAASMPQRRNLQYGYYHHGRQTNSNTVSALVQRTDIDTWPSDVWDYSGNFPTLK